MSSMIKEQAKQSSLLVKGFKRDIPQMLRKTVTENYPKSLHFQLAIAGFTFCIGDENGLEKCVGCFLCSAACPARCNLHRGCGKHRRTAYLRR